MAPRFLLDEQISPRVAREAAKAGLDIRAIAGTPFAGWDDPRVFRKAVEEGRILVTYNIRDMARILADSLKEGLVAAGVVFIDVRSIPPDDLPGLARALVRLAEQIRKGEIDPSCGFFLRR